LRPELETYQLIDNYLNGTLTGEELAAFEQRLQTDSSLAEEVSFVQLTNEVVVGATFDALRNQMSNDIADIDASKNTRTWGLTGLILGIVSIGVVGMYTLSTEEDTTSVTGPALQTPSVIKNQPAEQSAASEKITQPATTEKTNQLRTQTDVRTALPDEKIPLQTPLEKSTTDHAFTQIPVIKPAETIAHTPISKTTDAVNPCDQVTLKAVITSSPSCDDASNGSITIPINQISGGTKPYKIAFNKSTDAGTKEHYAYLPAGTYNINITDANGCTKNFSSEVTEKNCRKTSYVFAPDKGQVCTITAKEDESYVLTILNMAGKQVYKTNTMEGSFEWQGLSQQGEYLTAGLYIYILEYTSGEKENGQITIVR
jgi:hypothetical protein